MAIPVKRIELELEKSMEQRSALEERVEHIQRDVAELKTDVRRVESSLTEHRIETEKSFSALRVETKESYGSLRAEMKAMQVSFIRWMLGTALCLATLIVGVAKFLSDSRGIGS